MRSFQPLDGSKTVAWETPDPWECGRLDAKKPPPDSEEQGFDSDCALGPREPPPASDLKHSTHGSRLLLEIAQLRRPSEFMKIYLKSLPPSAKRERLRVKTRRKAVIARQDAARRAANKQTRRAEYRQAAAERAWEQHKEKLRQGEERQRLAEEEQEEERHPSDLANGTRQMDASEYL